MLRIPVEQSESGAIDGFHLKASICELGIRYIAWLAYRYHVDRSRLEPGSITDAANAGYRIVYVTSTSEVSYMQEAHYIQ